MPNKLLGQHFLKNHAIVQKIVAAVDIRPGDTILEIGPGHGELTALLAEVCGKVGAKLIAIEKDNRLAEGLNARNLWAGKENFEIISGDALKVLSSKFRVPNPFKIVGNIPYYLTGQLFRVVSEMEKFPERCVFTIQKEVGERLVAAPPNMNRLAASVQYWAEPQITARVSRRDFLPPPKVDSVAVVLKKRPKPILADADRYFAAVRALFAQPRKTIFNNLSASTNFSDKSKLAVALKDIGIDPGDRPQNISVEQIARVADAILLNCG